MRCPQCRRIMKHPMNCPWCDHASEVLAVLILGSFILLGLCFLGWFIQRWT